MSPHPIFLCHLVGSGGALRARTLLPPSVCLMGQEPMPGLVWVALESRRLHLGPECGFWATFMGPWLGPWSVRGCGAACGDCILAGGTAPRSSYVSRVCPRLCASAPAPRPPSPILRSSGSRNRPVLPSARLALLSPPCSAGYPSPAALLCSSRQEACPGSTRWCSASCQVHRTWAPTGILSPGPIASLGAVLRRLHPD